ncbi:hypothetical protein [Micromonospora coxensis]|uniref:Uncharacterized protein n=1 Tax=Micromonospora coxensis TaxID=356852 RepID=A0A1C5K000_9ACTN|nr:hypothetical protein [Micromonospora coxensis]SCG76145.1 hypothetical protein GA0070614_5855 [Micromonospora coxensis]
MTRSRAHQPPAEWPVLNSRAVSARLPGPNPQPPPAPATHRDQRRAYLLLGELALLAGALALLVAAFSR